MTSHLHETQLCWECDDHPDSSMKPPILLSLRLSYSASLAAPRTRPRTEGKPNRLHQTNTSPKPLLARTRHSWGKVPASHTRGVRKPLKARSHEGLALDSATKVSPTPSCVNTNCKAIFFCDKYSNVQQFLKKHGLAHLASLHVFVSCWNKKPLKYSLALA